MLYATRVHLLSKQPTLGNPRTLLTTVTSLAGLLESNISILLSIFRSLFATMVLFVRVDNCCKWHDRMLHVCCHEQR